MLMLLRYTTALLLAVLTLVSTTPESTAQPAAGGVSDVARRVALSYDFSPGERVSYRVVTYDSVALFGRSLLRQSSERTQHVTFTCDSVTRDGFIVTMTTESYVARERRDTLPIVTRTSHPWTSQTLTFLMAPDGRRVRLLSPADSASVAPSGPFQPLLLPYLGEGVASVGESKVFELSHRLVENVVPPVVFSGAVYRTIAGEVDTLGLPTYVVTFAETGKSSYPAPMGLTTDAIISGTSRHYFAPMLGFPVAGQVDEMFNLTLKSERGETATGRQTISMRYTMIDPFSEFEIPVAPNR